MSAPTVIIVNSASPYRTLADLLSAARAKPANLTAASAGQTHQIALEMLRRAAKIEMTIVPYPGGAPAVNALLGGHVTSALLSYSTASEQLKAGKLRALATFSRTRIEALPELPTVAESGYSDSEMDEWLGMLAPAKTPNEKVSQLVGWLTEALQAPELRAKFASLGLYSVGMCGAEFAAFLRGSNMATSAALFARRTSNEESGRSHAALAPSERRATPVIRACSGDSASGAF